MSTSSERKGTIALMILLLVAVFVIAATSGNFRSDKNPIDAIEEVASDSAALAPSSPEKDGGEKPRKPKKSKQKAKCVAPKGRQRDLRSETINSD